MHEKLISIIICTYNRSKKTIQLVNQLSTIKFNFNIIVVDSSDIINVNLSNHKNITYIRSSHKNQPYQRYLGSKLANSDYLIYLDDDMEVLSQNFLHKVKTIIEKNNNLAGIAFKFQEKHAYSYSNGQKSYFFTQKKRLDKLKRFLTGYPILSPGTVGLCGNRGKQPEGGGDTEWLSGGAFLVKKDFAFKNFNFQLFDLFEEKIGMGEDFLIGYTLSHFGDLIYHDETFFFHNDQKDSTYRIDYFTFNKRTLFSRLFLSLEIYRQKNRNLLLPYLHYHYYSFFKILGAFLNYLIKPGNKNFKDAFVGCLHGYFSTFSFNYDNNLHRRQYWENQILTDTNSV